MQAMAYVAYIFQSLGDNGCILGVMDDGIGVLGTDLSISGDLNLIQSDYQTYMNNALQKEYTSPSTADYTSVRVFTLILDKLITIFGNDAKNTSQGGPSILGIDPSEVSNILTNLCGIRKQIHIEWDDGSTDDTLDPTSNSDPTKWVSFESETCKDSKGDWPDGVYIGGYQDTDLIQGFNQLNYYAEQQGDTHHASDVLKDTDNDNNTTKTSLGSVSQVTNSNLSHSTNVEKEAMGFFDNFLHSFFKAMDAAVSNQHSQ